MEKKTGKSAELLIASWFLDSEIEVFLPTSQDAQADLVILARESITTQYKDADKLPEPQRFEPKNPTTCVRNLGLIDTSLLSGKRWLCAIEVKTGKEHEKKDVDFDFLVYLDQGSGEGAISRSSRYEMGGTPNHFPEDNLPKRPSTDDGWIFLPAKKDGEHSSIIYFGLPRACELRANFFTRVFVTFAKGILG